MSAAWDLENLMQPISPERPCGENLEDTPLLASFDVFRLFGQSMPFDSTRDWVEIRNRTVEALRQSKDLRLLAHLSAALLRTDGLAAYLPTIATASHWLDAYWDQVHPQVDEDALLRRNALNCFADPIAVIDGLRRAPIVASRQHGNVSLRDVDLASGQLVPLDGEMRPDESQIAAAFAAMPIDELQRLLERVHQALSGVTAIDAAMRGRAGEQDGPALDALANQLGRLARVLRTQLAARPETVSKKAVSGGSTDAAPVVLPGGVVQSRQEAILALDAVAEFFRRTEPSSPVPLFLDRAKRLVSKDFLEVLADIAPEALPQARAAGGVRSEP